MALKPINKRQIACRDLANMSIKSTTIDEDIKNQIKESWDTNIGITTVYKNFDFNTPYEMVVSEGNCEKNEYPYKTFQVYPYDNFVFDRGDYVSFMYRDRMCHFLISTIDNQFAYQVRGHMYLCNNMLRYVDEYGKLYEFPCVFNDKAQRTDFYYTNTINTVDGRIEVDVQKCAITNKISENNRFLFDGRAFKVTYLGNHNNNYCDDSKDDIGTTTFPMVIDEIQSTDDQERNIANADRMSLYSLEVNTDIVYGNIYDIGKIIATVYKDGKEVDEEVAFEIIEEDTDTQDNCDCNINCKYSYAVCECEQPVKDKIIEIDTEGNYKLLSIGTCKVKVYMKNNDDIFKIVTFTVSNVPKVDVIDIIISPDVDEVKQGLKQEYTCYKTINGIKDSEILNIVDNSSIESGYYNITIGTNTFTIENIKKHSSKKVEISVSDSIGNVENISIKLGGVF